MSDSTFVTQSEFLDMNKRLVETIAALADATGGLRTVSLVLAHALAKQPTIDAKKLLTDLSLAIDSQYPQDKMIPTTVLDFRAALAHIMTSG